MREILQELQAGQGEAAVKRWEEAGFEPFGGEDWEQSYNWLRRVMGYREGVMQAHLQAVLQGSEERQRAVAEKARLIAELQHENKLLKSLSVRSPSRNTSELLVLKAQIASLTQGIAERNAEIADLSAELAISNQEIERLSIVAAHLKVERTSETSENRGEDVLRLLREVQDLKEERKDLKKGLDDCNRLKDIIKHQEILIFDLQKQQKDPQSTLDEELKATKRYIKDLESRHLEEIEDLRALFSTEKQKYAKIVDELEGKEEWRAASERLAVSNAELQSKLAVFEQQASKLQANLKVSEREKRDMEGNLEEAQGTIRAYERSIADLKSQLEDQSMTLMDLNSRAQLEAINSSLQAETQRFSTPNQDDFSSEILLKQSSERLEELQTELQSALSEAQRHYIRAKELEGVAARLDEATTELEILRLEYSQCMEENRAQQASNRSATAELSSKLKDFMGKLATAESTLSLNQSNLRIKEEEIVQLTELIEQYKRQIQDCRDLLAGELPHSKRAKAYAAGLACDWDLVGKISDQLGTIEDLKASLEAVEKECGELKSAHLAAQQEASEYRGLSETLKTQLSQAQSAFKAQEVDYKERLDTFQWSLQEQKDALRQSHEDLVRRSADLQTELQQYSSQRQALTEREREAQEREFALQMQKEATFQRERELNQQREREFTQSRESEVLSSDEARRLSELSALNVSEVAESIGNMLEQWKRSLSPTLQSKLKTRKIVAKGEISADLSSIKAAVAAIIEDFGVVGEPKALDTSTEYENTLNFAQRLLQRFDRDGGHVEEALVVQIIMEKLYLEREIKKKAEQLLGDERFLARSEGLKEEGNRVKWVTTRWQESENEAYRLRSQFCENTKRLQDFFEEKGVGDKGGETVAELRKQVKTLRKELQEQTARVKAVEEAKRQEVVVAKPLAQQSAVDSLLKDMKAQQAQQKAAFEGKEKSWREALRSLREGLESTFPMDSATLAKIDPMGSPSVFVSLLLEAVQSGKKKTSDESTSHLREKAQLRAELDSWISKQEAWEAEKSTLSRTHERAQNETEKLKAELSNAKEMVNRVMEELKDLTRRAETEIPEENYNRGLVDGELRAKRQQKKLKLVISDYRDQMDQMKVKFESLQDQVVSLTAQNAKLQQEKQQLMEESRLSMSKFNLKSRTSMILQRTRTLQSRLGENGRDQDLDFDLPKPIKEQESQSSLQLSFSNEGKPKNREGGPEAQASRTGND
jgi:hypothetical protein